MISNASVPLKWVIGGASWLVSAFGFTLVVLSNVADYKADTDASIDALGARTASLEQSAAMARLDHDLLIEMRGDIKVLAAEARARSGDK